MSNSSWPHWLQDARPSCPSPSPKVCPRSCPLHRWCIQPFHPPMPSSPSLSIFLSIMDFSNKSVVCVRWSKYWSFSFSISPCNKYSGLISLKTEWFGGRSQVGGGIEQEDHFLPHRFIKRSFECLATSTKKLLNAGRGHQAPRKAAHSLWKEVGQSRKDKKRDKRVRDETHPGEGVVKEEKFPNSRKPSHWWVCGEFWNLRGQHNREGENTHTHTHTHTLTHTHTHREYTPNHNSQQRSNPDAHVHRWTGRRRLHA